jgi:hypothetical protein
MVTQAPCGKQLAQKPPEAAKEQRLTRLAAAVPALWCQPGGARHELAG